MAVVKMPEPQGPFELRTERLGPLPIVNQFIEVLGIDEVLARFVPAQDRGAGLPYAKGLGVLLRSVVVEREPIYRQEEMARSFAPGLFGVAQGDECRLSDDHVGRALDRLFDTDRAALMTEVAIRMVRRYDVRIDELHNDSTTIRFAGQYVGARGRSIRGKRAPWITYGHSKDKRPDLKQLLFVMTTSADGGVPLQFRCGDGNANDAITHVETWEALRKIAGRPDFLYVADSKLCTHDNMDYIDGKRGRFVTVMPRDRKEDTHFRKRIQTEELPWELVWDRRNPRKKYGPRDRWWVYRYDIPSREAWPITWVFSSLLRLKQDRSREERLTAAVEAFQDLKRRLANPRTRLRKASVVGEHIEEILERFNVKRYLKARRTTRDVHRFVQRHRGRPGPGTAYRRVTRRLWDVEWELDQAIIAYDRKSDGMYPLLSNDRELTPKQVLEAHKGQPRLEKRFSQIKTVHEIAPVLLHNEGRIEALFFLYFLGMLVQGLIERELRRNMAREGIAELPLYPEERTSTRPTTEQVLRLFSLAQGNILRRDGQVVQMFQPELTELQLQILGLLGMSPAAYRLR
jgi:transposase